jgi:hypothetical protein
MLVSFCLRTREHPVREEIKFTKLVHDTREGNRNVHLAYSPQQIPVLLVLKRHLLVIQPADNLYLISMRVQL